MKPKKSLGQNFLNSMPALGKIVAASEIVPGETILEIGPGKGALTNFLLEAGAKVIAVEKDELLAENLKEIQDSNLKIITGDILEQTSETLGLKAGKYKVVANIPYYITGEIIRKFLTEERQPSRMVLLVQREVAQRIMARDGKESLLSISVKAFGTPEYIGTVKRGSFFPAPNVDSAILLIKDIHLYSPGTAGESKFFEVLHAGFAHKRKKLKGNLITSLSATGGQNNIKEKVNALFADLSLDENVRAEDLTLEMWKRVALKLHA